MNQSPNEKELWTTALGEIELAVSNTNFNTWFKNTEFKRHPDGTTTIYAPNFFNREWLENKYNTIILTALQRVDSSINNIRYEVALGGNYSGGSGNSTVLLTKKPQAQTQENSSQQPTAQQNPASTDEYDTTSNLNARYTFDSFVIGSHNELAFAACQAVAKKPGNTYNPLFLYGGVGLGKTHLLQATGNALMKNFGKNVLYSTSEKFTSELITSIGKRTTSNFKSKYREIDVLIVDDIQFIAGKDKTQDEFFHTFNELYSLNKQIIISSDRPPKAIATLEERLRSRFEGGMVADISMPDLETRVAILEKKCEQKGVHVIREALQYIATHVAHNIRELEGALNRVLATNQLNGTTITLESAKHILSSTFETPKKKAVHMDKVVEAVCGYYNIVHSEIFSKSRRKEIVRPRQVAMYILRKDNGSSFPTIGTSFGGRDHTTAMHACEKIEGELETDDILQQDIILIRQKIYA
ncbi:MAG: chromosomal replication initiator protein DnaA [bacterium]|nr:chromosomal replication initiator protein DnaA [bacterium]